MEIKGNLNKFKQFNNEGKRIKKFSNNRRGSY